MKKSVIKNLKRAIVELSYLIIEEEGTTDCCSDLRDCRSNLLLELSKLEEEFGV